MAQRSRCDCGKVKSRYSNECKECYDKAYTARIAEAQAIVFEGKCPKCGAKLKRNLSLAGWWQCEQLGAETHRKDPSKPSCSFQVFTE